MIELCLWEGDGLRSLFFLCADGQTILMRQIQDAGFDCCYRVMG
jgi:hypothetical protein